MQEVAGKGLALVYQAAGRESKQGLVDSLVDALSTGRRRAAASGSTTGTAAGRGGGVDVHGTTHAGAALSEAGAGAYGEMCAVSSGAELSGVEWCGPIGRLFFSCFFFFEREPSVCML